MKLLLSLTLVLYTSFASAQSCKSLLKIETDDDLYPGVGEVQLCTNHLNQITKLVVIKPVQNPKQKLPQSHQADERNPILTITLDQINSTSDDIAILTPSRLGITVKAALLQPPEKSIDKENGGLVVLKVLKSKILGSYHYFKLGLVKENDGWNAYLINGKDKVDIERAFFSSGVSGIKRVEFY